MKKHLLSCAILLACSPVFAAGNTDSIEARLAAWKNGFRMLKPVLRRLNHGQPLQNSRCSN